MNAQVLQLSLFDIVRAPMIVRDVDPDGRVLQGKARLTFDLPHQNRAWPYARIEVHPARGGLWMWSASFDTGANGVSYKVGEKWGHFAASPSDALYYAVEELITRVAALDRVGDRNAARILRWAKSLALEVLLDAGSCHRTPAPAEATAA